MISKRAFLDYLEDIADAADKISQFVKGITYAQFTKDSRTSYAVVRALEIIGEAAKQVPSFIKSNHPEIPWRDLAGIRDKLIHNYFGVNLEVVWKTALEDVPNLALKIRSILVEMGQQSSNQASST